MTEKLCLQWNDFQENIKGAFGKLREGIIVVSGSGSGSEVELFDNEQWIRQPDFTLNQIHGYSTATIDNKLYVFGKQKKRMLIIFSFGFFIFFTIFFIFPNGCFISLNL